MHPLHTVLLALFANSATGAHVPGRLRRERNDLVSVVQNDVLMKRSLITQDKALEYYLEEATSARC